MGFLDKIFGKKEDKEKSTTSSTTKVNQSNKTKSDEELADIALNAPTYDERYDAASNIEDRTVLSAVLIKTNDDNFKNFVNRFYGNDTMLGNIATNTENTSIGTKAVSDISDDNIGVLAAISDKAKNYTVRDKASMKILKGSQLYGNGAW